MKNGVFWEVTPSGCCKNRVSEELSASIIRVTITGELGTCFIVACVGCYLRLTLFLVHRLLTP
jgi:hypothetical protein